MNHQWLLLCVGLALSTLVAVSIELSGRNLASGWLVGLAVQVCWIIFAVVTQTWTLVIGPMIVGPRFWKNWKKWHKRDLERLRRELDDPLNAKPEGV